VLKNHATFERQKECQCVCRDFIYAVIGNVESNDVSRFEKVRREVVETDTLTANDLQVGAGCIEQIFSDLAAVDDERVGSAQCVEELLTLEMIVAISRRWKSQLDVATETLALDRCQ
jgi:hypothetical protein